MPTTSNFGWTTPADTDLVKDGAAAIRTLGNGIDTSLVDLKGGTTGQILSKASNADMDFTFITPNVGDITEVQAGTGISVASGTGPIPVVTNTVATAFDAAGDLVYGTGADTFTKLSLGTANQVLTVNSGATAPEWKTPTGSDLKLITTETFSASAAVNINNCFSATYTNYFIIARYTMSSAQDLMFRMRLSGTNATGNDYTRQLISASSTTVSALRGTSTEFPAVYDAGSLKAYIFSPFVADPTYFQAEGFGVTSNAFWNQTYGQHNVSTAYDGISIYPGSGTITGTIRIYGLKD